MQNADSWKILHYTEEQIEGAVGFIVGFIFRIADEENIFKLELEDPKDQNSIGRFLLINILPHSAAAKIILMNQ